MNKTAKQIEVLNQPTIGEVALDIAKDLARIAAERALTNDWTEHPMHGIAVDSDKWAIEYQRKLNKLKSLLTPSHRGMK